MSSTGQIKNLLVEYRPRRFNQLLGNVNLKREFAGMLRTGAVPPGMVFTGPPGCGKTTAAYLMIRRLHCEKSPPHQLEPCWDCVGCDIDLQPSSQFQGMGVFAFNCSTLTRGELAGVLDLTRYAFPMLTIFLDEAHRASEPILDQLLTFLEVPSPNTVLMLSLIDDAPLEEALMQRLYHFKLRAPPPQEIVALLRRVWTDTTDEPIEDDLLAAIVDMYEAVPRKCINALRQILFRGIRTLDELRRQ